MASNLAAMASNLRVALNDIYPGHPVTTLLTNGFKD